MIREYLKMIGRRILRHKIYAIINVVGFTIAFTSVLLIYMHVVKEWKTDRFHQHADQIYRVTLKSKYDQNWSSYTSAPTAPYAAKEFPGIEEYVRVADWLFDVKKATDKEYLRNKNCLQVDKQFFDLFSFPLVSGDVKQDWGKDWMVVSRKEALRYFDNENPLGQVVRVKSGWNTKDPGHEYRIVAVMEDFPAFSSLQADYVMDLSSKEDLDAWGGHGFYTYFKLNKDIDPASIEKGIPEMIERNYEYIAVGEQQFKLQPLKEVYLKSEHIAEDLPHGSRRLNVILAGVAILILFLTAGNYLMISMAQLHTQAIGIVMQRCLGADNRILFWRVFWEIVLYACIALSVSGVLVWLLHPGFVTILSSGKTYDLSVTWGEIALFLGMVVLLMVGMGLILAGWMKRHINQHSVREILQRFSGRLDMKIVLSVLQMCIFTALLACSVILTRQMNFIEKRNLGFDNQQVVNFSWDFGDTADLESVRQEIRNADPDILTYTNGDNLPLLHEDPEELSPDDQPDLKIKAYFIHGDAYYLPTYRIELAEGRNIEAESYPRIAEDFLRAEPKGFPEILVNEEFARRLGKKEVLGSLLKLGDGFRTFRIVGVVKDFHFLPLYEKIQPMVIAYELPLLSYSISVRYREGCRQKVIGHLQQLYEERFPGMAFRYTEYEFSQLYNRDMALVKMIHIFTAIAILVGGMGILAFSMFMAESRRKEVALRKVNGAGVGQIILLLDRQFLGRILLACAIGLPIAHHLMTLWLRGFAYRTELPVGLYLGVAVICVVFVLLTVTWQIFRAARINPVDVLKNE